MNKTIFNSFTRFSLKYKKMNHLDSCQNPVCLEMKRIRDFYDRTYKEKLENELKHLRRLQGDHTRFLSQAEYNRIKIISKILFQDDEPTK